MPGLHRTTRLRRLQEFSAFLRRFMSDRGKIKSRGNTGTCVQHQHDVAIAIKNVGRDGAPPYAVRTMAADKGGGRRGRGSGPGTLWRPAGSSSWPAASRAEAADGAATESLAEDVLGDDVLADGVLADGVLADGVLADGVLADGVLAEVCPPLNGTLPEAMASPLWTRRTNRSPDDRT